MTSLRPKHLRTQLALTYAGIAALTAVLLGAILFGVLGSYYARSERAFLAAAGARVTASPPAALDSATLTEWVLGAALDTRARVRVYGTTGELLADSGSPSALRADEFRGRGPGFGPGRGRGDDDEMPRPLGEGIFGGSGRARGSAVGGEVLTVPVLTAVGLRANVRLSEPPVSGSEVLSGIAQGWGVAALLAVVFAALAGYLLSTRLSRPVVALTEASDRMAEGDLATRAEITRADEFGRLAESFNGMAERMEDTVGSLRRFVADAAHEIGTPLTALEADLQLAERAATTDDERRLVSRALSQARRLEALAQGLLRLSRLEAHEGSDSLEVTDVAALAKEAADGIASRAEAAELELEVDVAAEPLPVLADRAKLASVFEALLDNAVKFTPAGGKVSLSTRRDGDAIVVNVSDTGLGIPLAEQDAVFERFHRARNVAAIPGSGLGLAIVRATVTRFGGEVCFESGEGGTRFEVSLPAAGSQ